MSNFQAKLAEKTNFESDSTRPSAVKKVTSIASQNLFQVIGGPVLIKSIVGLVTTVFQTQTNNTKLTHTAFGGSAIDLCATANVSALAKDKMFTVVGPKATALKLSADAGVLAYNDLTSERYVQVLSPGTLALNCSATNTGAAEVSIVYEPLAPGARVEAV